MFDLHLPHDGQAVPASANAERQILVFQKKEEPWVKTANASQDETDGEKLKRFVSGLPPRSIIRHHVAGDIGAE